MGENSRLEDTSRWERSSTARSRRTPHGPARPPAWTCRRTIRTCTTVRRPSRAWSSARRSRTSTRCWRRSGSFRSAGMSAVSAAPQANEFKHTQGRWPEKSVKMLIGLLKNAEANAESKNLDTDKLIITHIAVNRAPPGRRRTYRAHGRVTPYQSGPCHIQLFLEEKVETVEKPEGVKKEVKLTRKQLARKRLPVGGDA